MSRSSKTKKHRRSPKTKCRQVGRVPDIVWRKIVRGYYASNAQSFTQWAARALIEQAKEDIRRRKELDRIATEILQKTIAGQNESIKSRRAKLKFLLAEEADAV